MHFFLLKSDIVEQGIWNLINLSIFNLICLTDSPAISAVVGELALVRMALGDVRELIVPFLRIK